MLVRESSVTALVLLSAVTLNAGQALGQVEYPESLDPSVVLLADRTAQPLFVRIHRAVESQMTDLDIGLEIHWADEHPTTQESQVELIEQIGQTSWAVFLFVPDAPVRLFLSFNGAVYVRNLAGMDSGSNDEILALIIREVVRGLLSRTENQEGFLAGTSGWEQLEAHDEDDVPPAEIVVGTQDDVSAPPDPIAPPLTPTEPSERRRDVLFLQLGYGFMLWGPESPIAHAIPAWIQWNTSIGIFVRGGYQFVIPATVDTEEISTTFVRNQVRFDLGYRYRYRRLLLDASFDVLLDIVTTKTTVVDPLVGEGDPLFFEVALGATLRVGVVVLPRLSLWTGLGFDAYLGDYRYVIDTVNGPRPFAEPWRVRFRFHIGISIALI